MPTLETGYALKDILSRDIARDIDGVIKAEDDRRLLQEVEEYVITREIERELKKFQAGYMKSIESNSGYPFNGVWISGYFGSGKSHLLKMLSLVMPERTVNGIRLRDIFLDKIDDVIFREDVKKMLEIPSTSILFNIEQHAERAKAKGEHAILYAFERLFNRMLGYYDEPGAISELERDLDAEGRLEAWRTAFRERNGVSWEDHRPKALLLGRRLFLESIAAFRSIGIEEASRIIDQYEKSYSVSVDSFCVKVAAWLDRQPDPRHRINFFVDEVGQFVAGNSNLMLSLQTIAEAIGVITKERAWIFVTSQESLENLVGEFTRKKSDEFSRIVARFKFRIALSSADVREVIQKRLLEKNEHGTEVLRDFYRHEKDSLRTVFAFGHGAKAAQFKDEEAFVYSYPFPAYQYDLLQDALRGLGAHNAFIGAHVSRGERSMLEIFQDVGKNFRNKPLFGFAPFDAMFDGIRNTLYTGLITAINQAERNLSDELAVRILKALLLVKYIGEFKATVENIKVLLADRLELDMAGLGARIEESLARLERETYIRRNGELYEYLTDDEKDVEEEIRGLPAEEQDCRSFVSGIVFGEVLKSTRLRYAENGEDYQFQRAIDDDTPKGQGDLVIRIATPWHPDAGNRTALLARAMGRKELLVILPPDPRFMDELELQIKTDAWLRRAEAKEAKYARIHAEKLAQNGDRRKRLSDQVKDLLKRAEFAVMDQEISVTGGTSLDRIERAFQDLVSRSYPNLRMLKVHYTQDSLRRIMHPSGNDLFDSGGSERSEAEIELGAWIQRKRSLSQPITLAGIEEEFEKGQYGWYEWGVLCIVALLYMRQEIELSRSSEILGKDDAFTALNQNRGHAEISVRPAPVVTQDDIRKLKDLHRKLFYTENDGANGKETAIRFKEALLSCKNALAGTISGAPDFPFLSEARDVVQRIDSILKNEWHWFLESRSTYAQELSDLVLETAEPMQTFLNGPNAETWRRIDDWMRDHNDNLAEIGMPDAAAGIRSCRSSLELYKTSETKRAKDLWNSLLDKEKTLLEAERTAAAAKIELQRLMLASTEGWQTIDEPVRTSIEKGFDELRAQLEKKTTLSSIRDAAATRAQKLLESGRKKAHEILNPEVRIVFASADEKHVEFSKHELSSEADVEAYAKALADHWKRLIASGKWIGL